MLDTNLSCETIKKIYNVLVVAEETGQHATQSLNSDDFKTYQTGLDNSERFLTLMSSEAAIAGLTLLDGSMPLVDLLSATQEELESLRLGKISISELKNFNALLEMLSKQKRSLETLQEFTKVKDFVKILFPAFTFSDDILLNAAIKAKLINSD